MMTGCETPFLALAPAVEATTDREDVRVFCVEEMAQVWEREAQALSRRSRLRLVRGAQHGDGDLSVA